MQKDQTQSDQKGYNGRLQLIDQVANKFLTNALWCSASQNIQGSYILSSASWLYHIDEQVLILFGLYVSKYPNVMWP